MRPLLNHPSTARVSSKSTALGTNVELPHRARLGHCLRELCLLGELLVPLLLKMMMMHPPQVPCCPGPHWQMPISTSIRLCQRENFNYARYMFVRVLFHLIFCTMDKVTNTINDSLNCNLHHLRFFPRHSQAES